MGWRDSQIENGLRRKKLNKTMKSLLMIVSAGNEAPEGKMVGVNCTLNEAPGYIQVCTGDYSQKFIE